MFFIPKEKKYNYLAKQMTNKKTYQPMKIVKLGNLDEVTELANSNGKSGFMTDGNNQVGNMMN